MGGPPKPVWATRRPLTWIRMVGLKQGPRLPGRVTTVNGHRPRPDSPAILTIILPDPSRWEWNAAMPTNHGVVDQPDEYYIVLSSLELGPKVSSKFRFVANAVCQSMLIDAC